MTMIIMITIDSDARANRDLKPQWQSRDAGLRVRGSTSTLSQSGSTVTRSSRGSSTLTQSHESVSGSESSPSTYKSQQHFLPVTVSESDTDARAAGRHGHGISYWHMISAG